MANATPAVSVAAVVMVAVQVVLSGKLVACLSTAIRFEESYVTTPAIGVPLGHSTVKLELFKLDGSMLRLNFAVSAVLTEMPDAMGTSLAGVVRITRGVMVKLGVPRIGSCPPEPPHATKKQVIVATTM